MEKREKIMIAVPAVLTAAASAMRMIPLLECHYTVIWDIIIAAAVIAAAAVFREKDVKKMLKPDIVAAGILWDVSFCYIYIKNAKMSGTLLALVLLAGVPLFIWLAAGIKRLLAHLRQEYLSYPEKRIDLGCKKNSLVIAGTTLLQLLLYWKDYAPYQLSPDCRNQWKQIHGEIPYCDVHAVAHTIYLKALFSIWDSFTIAVLVQITLILLLFGLFAHYFSKKGVPLAVQILLFGTFNSGIGNMEPFIFPWKDAPHTFFIGLLLLVVMQVLDNAESFSAVRGMLTGAVLAGVFLFRLNGIVTVIFAAVFFAWKLLPLKKFGQLAAMAVSFAVIFTANHWYAYDVLDTRTIPNGFGLQVFGTGIAAAVNDGSASQEELDEVGELLPLDWIQEKYEPWFLQALIWREDGAPGIKNDPERDVLNNTLILRMGEQKAETVKLYFRLLPHHIPACVMNVIQSTVIVWGHCHVSRITIWSDNITMLLLIFLAAAVCWKRRQLRKLWTVFLPVAGNIISIAISTVTNETRYLFSTFVLAPFMILFILTTTDSERGTD